MQSIMGTPLVAESIGYLQQVLFIHNIAGISSSLTHIIQAICMCIQLGVVT